MTQATATPAPPPTAPAIAGTPTAATAIPSTLTYSDILALRARRNELSNQLTSVGGRRRTLASELKTTTDPTAKAGLESRITVLDNRINQLESDIAATGRILTSDAAGRVAATRQANFPMGIDPADAAPFIGAFIFLVLMPIGIGLGRMFWKRGSHPPLTLPPAVAQSAERLGRLEQSVDAIAVEIERISEGQRFVTKLLSEKAPVLPSVNEQLKDTTQYQVP